MLYAQQHFPQFVAKHEKGMASRFYMNIQKKFVLHEFFISEIQRTMCLLAYEGSSLPPSYASLRDEALWPDAIEVFLRDACALLRLPPLRLILFHDRQTIHIY